MAGTMIRQTMFTTGEVDQITWKRTDASVYLTAAQSLLNCEVGTTGLAKKRKGTAFVLAATAYATSKSKMYELIDKNDNHYLIMSADQKFYVFSTPSDDAVVVTGRGTTVVTERSNTVVANQDYFISVQTITSPYLLADIDQLDYTQDNDSIIFTNSSYPPGRIFIDDYTTLHFSYEVLDIFPPPSYDFNTINYNQYTAAFTNPSSTTFQLVLTGTDAGNITTAWIDGMVIGLGKSDIDPVGYGIITAVTPSSGTVTIVGNVVVPFAAPSDMSTLGSQYSVRQPAWSTILGYPSKVLYFQNRLWFANTLTLPNTVFGSKINAPINFDLGTGRDTDAIVYTIGQTDSGSIRWMNGGKQLEIFTENYEYACPQDTNAALTPSTFSIRLQSSYGSSEYFKPITYINNSYYVTKTGKAVITYFFTGVGLSYKSSNISVASSHLILNPLNRALLRGADDSQDNFIYFNNGDHTLTSFQFASEYKLAAFTPIKFQEDIQLVDIVTIDNSVFILKYYVKTAVYTVEEMVSEIKLDGYREMSMPLSGVILGLDDFNGYTVQVVYKNQDLGSYLVSGGQITVDNVTGVADTVSVGLLYDVEITPMYIFGGQTASPYKKTISRIYVDYFNSLDFQINGKLVPYQNFADIQAGNPLTPQTDTAIIDRVNGWERFGTITISQSSPFDLQILGIGYEVKAAVI